MIEIQVYASGVSRIIIRSEGANDEDLDMRTYLAIRPLVDAIHNRLLDLDTGPGSMEGASHAS